MPSASGMLAAWLLWSFFRRAENQKGCPLPGVLRKPTWPPIRPASLRVMARPRPVPPYLRVVELVGLLEGTE